MPEYDLVIIGGGAAGLTAGVYAARAGMQALLLEQAAAGGQMLWTEVIENFPGFPEGITGLALSEKLNTQAIKSGLKINTEQVKAIAAVKSLPGYSVKTQQRQYTTHAVILASGAMPKRLGLPAEEKFTGRGLSYCATCDGSLFRNREVVVLGGGNAAVEEALYLSKLVSKVTLIHRRDRLRADQVLQERVKASPKIEIVWQSRVVEILGKDTVSGVKIEQIKTASRRDIPCAGIFIFVGIQPNTDFVKGLVKLDREGFILTKQNLQTSRRGIFACGDCRARLLAQIVTACGEGAQAAVACHKYVEQLKGTSYV